MTSVDRYYPENRFGGFTDADGSLLFYARVQELIPNGAAVLDVGCGRGMQANDPVAVRRALRDLRTHADRVIGIDVDDVGETNPLIHEFRRIDGPTWPVESESVDVAVADWVLEHVPDPPAFFSEMARVLKNGGVVCMRTSNVRSAIGLAAKIIPNRMHARVLEKTGHGRAAHDVFPTVHRCNTVGALRRGLERSGFDACVYGYEAEPQYLNFSRMAYALGVLHQRFAPRAIRASIFAFARKR